MSEEPQANFSFDDEFELSSGQRCRLTRTRVPFVRYSYVLHLAEETDVSRNDAEELVQCAARIAPEIAASAICDREGFTIIHNGHSVTRASGPHVHIVCLRSRWRKAWFYFVLAMKNWLHPVHRLFSRRKRRLK